MQGAFIFKLLHAHSADEIISAIFMQLCSPRRLAICAGVCKLWRKIANQDNLWKDLCIRFWADKAAVPKCFRSLLCTGRSKEAFIESLRDSRRTSITAEELSSFKFYFRFKRVAGRYWTEKDPFWSMNEPLRISFSPDGLVTGFPWNALQMRWHFVDDDGRACEREGSFMRVAINGRCVPTYTISRHSNWGIILQVNFHAHFHIAAIIVPGALKSGFAKAHSIFPCRTSGSSTSLSRCRASRMTQI